MFDWEEKEVAERSIQPGELVECMFLGSSLPSSYEKELEQMNLKKQKEADAIGEKYVWKMPTLKDSGISWDIAILQHNVKVLRDEHAYKGQDIWKFDGLKYNDPGFIATTMFTQWAPRVHRDKALSDSIYQWIGSSELDKSGAPKMWPRFPSTKESMDPSEEAKRLQKWQTMIDSYEASTEDERKDFLDTAVARRLLLCNIVDGSAVYLKPTAGMRFLAYVWYSSKSKYPNLSPTKFENGVKHVINYFICKQEPSPTDLLIAGGISQARQEARDKWMNEKSHKQQISKEESNEEW